MNAQQKSGAPSASLSSLGLMIVLLTAVITPLSASALGFRIPNQDAESTAKGNAVIATADNPSAIYYNPAGITQIGGTEAQFGMHVITVDSHFQPLSGHDSDTKFELQPVPQFYAVYALSNYPVTLGLGMYAPYGLGLQWPGDAQLRNFGIEGRLTYVTLAPVAAWEILPGLSIAAGPTIDYSQVKLRRGIGGVPGDVFRFTGDGYAAGAKAGLRWQPLERWAFGVSYVSPTTVTFDGGSTAKPETQGKRPTKADIRFPQFIMGGVSFRPTPRWNVELGVDWTDWGTVDTPVFEGTAFGNVPFPLNWRSSYMIYSGVERYFDNNYWVAAGYFYSQDSTSDKQFTPLVPDTDLHVASIGIGRKGVKWDWGLSFQVITGPKRDIQNGTAADGAYHFFNEAVNWSISRRF
ncbi:MAG TPA: outer membrane protein transport protein [Verrucomicrobiae bacterium]|nr:outer membrane protein transport protein [Verrucomicrobiae bacterium]